MSPGDGSTKAGTGSSSTGNINVSLVFDAVVADWGDDKGSGTKGKGSGCGGCSSSGNDVIQVRYRPSGGSWTSWYTPSVVDGHFQYNAGGLSECSSYEWQTRAYNGCEAAEGPVWTFKTDCRPSVVSIHAVDTSCSDSWSGVFENGANNPLTIRAVYRDPDGYRDIDRVFVAMAADEVDDMGSIGCGSWERDLCDSFGLYYEDNTVTITDDNKPSSGCPWLDSGDGENSRILVEEITSTSLSSEEVEYRYVIRLKGDFPGGEFKFFGLAEDESGVMSCNGDPSRSGCWDEGNPWNVDLTLPVGFVNPFHQPGDPADEIRFEQTGEDPGDVTSGLKRVFLRRYNIDRNEEIFPDEDSYYSYGGDLPLSGESEWGPEITGAITPPCGLTGGDIVNAWVSFEDFACNKSIVDDSHNWVEAGREWMQTKFGSVYSALGYSNPVIEGQYMNSYVTTGIYDDGVAEKYWFPGDSVLSGNAWTVKPYDDNNRVFEWADMLKRLVRSSMWLRSHDIEVINTIPEGGRLDLDTLDSDGVWEYTGSDDLTVFSSTGSCSSRKILLVGDINLDIEPDIKLSGKDSACLFVSRGSIRVLSGSNAGGSDNEDVLEAGLVADGNFETVNDNNHDRLRIRGLVVADTVSFDRDLVFEDNLLYPSELIVYDPRILYLLRDMLGRRPFEEFKCGTVKDSPTCEGWD
ncbi:hypothetical protein JW710_00355 [Candidatus Dojkabacteria bacterium]|nr:hypothetical protein [Candidatus Dojkabacteria bacterium]